MDDSTLSTDSGSSPASSMSHVSFDDVSFRPYPVYNPLPPEGQGQGTSTPERARIMDPESIAVVVYEDIARDQGDQGAVGGPSSSPPSRGSSANTSQPPHLFQADEELVDQRGEILRAASHESLSSVEYIYLVPDSDTSFSVNMVSDTEETAMELTNLDGGTGTSPNDQGAGSNLASSSHSHTRSGTRYSDGVRAAETAEGAPDQVNTGTGEQDDGKL